MSVEYPNLCPDSNDKHEKTPPQSVFNVLSHRKCEQIWFGSQLE